jgi:hypothetical protein
MKPSRHIDAALAAIDRLFPLENEHRKFCWKCQDNRTDNEKAGLCDSCREELRAGDVDDGEG